MQKKSIQLVLREHTDSLMALQGVVGTAQGQRDGKPCIKVFELNFPKGQIRKVTALVKTPSGRLARVTASGNRF